MLVVKQIFEYIIELGPVLIIPLLLFILSLFTGKNPLIILKNCILVFIGLLLVAIMLTSFVNFFEPLINTIVINSSKDFQVIDLGFEVSEYIAFNSPIVIHIVIAVILLNIVMLFLRLTRTINIDLWNFWIFLFTGSLIYSITEIQWIGILVSLIIASVTLVVADIYAPYIGEYYGMEGISTPQPQSVFWAPISQLINYILNKIPKVKRLHLFYEEIQYKLGFLSEPMVFGFILGFIIGVITKYKTITANLRPDLFFAFGSGLRLAIIMIILPRAFNILARGLVPLVNNIRQSINRKITKREIYIGVDTLAIAGHPSVISLSLIMIPLTVYIATLLPGNRLLPSADLIFIPFILIWAIAPSRGDVFRSFISAIIFIPIILWICTGMADLYTNIIMESNIEIPEGFSKVSSIGSGANLVFWVLLQILKPILNLFL
ncbi:MAG: PTS transporter subunit IIC [Actinomycetota bacterium]